MTTIPGYEIVLGLDGQMLFFISMGPLVVVAGLALYLAFWGAE